MKFLLVCQPHFDYTYDGTEDIRFPFGLAYISAMLKRAGHDVRCQNLYCTAGREQGINAYASALNAFKPDVVGLSSISFQLPHTKQFVEIAKQHNPYVLTVLGGPTVSALPEFTLGYTGIDVGVLGEGEETVVDLAERLTRREELEQVNGIILRNKQGLFKTADRNPTPNLDNLPWPDYEGFDYDQCLSSHRYSNSFCMRINARKEGKPYSPPRSGLIFSSRSCPFKCSFCWHYHNKYRYRDIDDVVLEIRYVISRYGVNTLNIMDEVIGHDKKRIMRLADEIAGYGVLWGCQMHPTMHDEELIRHLTARNCFTITYGFESMSQTILDSMNKKTRAEDYKKTIREVNKYNIGFQSNFIMADPAETKETVNETLKWWISNLHSLISLVVVQYYPNSKIFQLARELCKIRTIDEYYEKLMVYINCTKMDDADYQRLYALVNSLRQTVLLPGKTVNIEKTGSHPQYGTSLYRVTAICPHCGKHNIYEDFHHTPNSPSTLRIACSHCYKIYDVFLHQNVTLNDEQRKIYGEAQSQEKQGNFQEAFNLYNRLLAECPNHRDSMLRIGILLLKNNHIDQALSIFESCLKKHPEDAVLHLTYADALMAAGNYGLAVIHYHQAAVVRASDAEFRDVYRPQLETIDCALKNIDIFTNKYPYKDSSSC